MIALLLALGCGPKEIDTGTAPAETEPTHDYTSHTCDELIIDVNGEDPPVVGDLWTVWLYCDEALLTGTQILQFDPPELATVTDNNATFLIAGEGTMRIQVGSKRSERAVVVGE